MKNQLSNGKSLLLMLLILTLSSLHSFAQSPDGQKVYYGIEIDGVLCGYSESIETLLDTNSTQMIKSDMHLFLMLSALGSEFNTDMRVKSFADVKSKKCSRFEMHIDQGFTKVDFEVSVDNNIATINSSQNSQPIKIELREDVLFGEDEFFNVVKKDFLYDGAVEKSYDILEAMEAEIQTSIVKKIGEETIELAGKTFNTIILEKINKKTGLKVQQWLTDDYDYFVMTKVLNRRIYLADHSVVDKIKIANMDASLSVPTNKSISDVPSIYYMKLKAIIEPTGVNLKAEDLNIPGQKFTGTVTENHIDGIFEIEYPRYDGKNAPQFPFDYSKDENLKKYIEPESNIQSDDPILITKAEDITEGAKDSWDAATKITKWVADNISYAIPGGGNARKTYDIRAGECGAHSMLVTAFCRAVGIPSRVVWGAMYIPNNGGSFGQHGWNEIYMGEAGWIPVDATAFENDFVDAGHIRIGELEFASTSFNGKEIEILEYKLANQSGDSESAPKFNAYLGKYTNIEAERTFEILEKDRSLSLDIPGKMVLPFHNVDEYGKWICKLTGNLYLEFPPDEKRDLSNMVIHEIATMTKKSPPEDFDDGVPDKFRPYLGTYLFAQINQEFEVLYLNGSLAVKDPSHKDPIKLQPPDEKGGWKDEFNKNTIYFEMNENGEAVLLKFDGANLFLRGELAMPIVEKVIDSLGIEAGLKKYRELENAEPDIYIFTEAGINRLGYKYVESGKLDIAIEIMKLNIEAYPMAWNTYDSMGDVYARNGQIDLAIPNFKKSLELNPENTHAKGFLKQPHFTKPIFFDSGDFSISAELKLPATEKKIFPLVIMVHGDGNGFKNYHNMLKYSFLSAGYATLIWDKPGNGGSSGRLSDDSLYAERSSILLNAIETMKNHPNIDPDLIGVWGISQAGYVIPKSLTNSNDIKFMILTGASGENGIKQTAYFISQQILCEGFTEDQAKEAEELVVKVSSATTYEDYKKYGSELLEKYPIVKDLDYMASVLPEEKWKSKNQNDDRAYFNPITVIEKTTIPTLVFLGELDKNIDPLQSKEAYETAFKNAGNQNYKVEFIQGADHDIILCETGCQKERNNRSGLEWSNYAPEYLEKIESWLTELRK
ncbi:MAG: hypothetical protein K9N07_09400 [Candidatus Cloacimonetes bacterium]|nr:hypothetical protein [Candidatus Cloacimonadota bacterium]